MPRLVRCIGLRGGIQGTMAICNRVVSHLIAPAKARSTNEGGPRDDYRLDPICAIEGALCCQFAVPNEYQIDTVDTDEFSQVSDL